MEYFKKYFSDVDFEGKNEVKVLCPFHDDTHPSASINVEKNLFHCFVCGAGYSEEQFYAKINNVSENEARELLNKSGVTSEWELTYKPSLWADEKLLNTLHNMGWSNQTIEELGLGKATYRGATMLAIPNFCNSMLVGFKQYNIYKKEGVPKTIVQEDDEIGWLCPYSLWKNDDSDTTYIFEGEKDMITARNLGINGITFGGVTNLPNKQMLEELKGYKVVICYDNDNEGRKGTIRLARILKKYVSSLKYVNIGDVVKEDKEDFFDFINKYGCDEFDFYALEQHEFVDLEEQPEEITIQYALTNNILNKSITSIVTVASEYSDTFAVPTSITVTKGEETGAKNEKMTRGEKREWFLTSSNLRKVLELIEVDAKSANVMTKLLGYLGISSKEENIEIKYGKPLVIYKSAITDRIVDGSTVSVDLYSTKNIIVGNQYKINYKLCTHPSKNQKVVAISDDIESASDMVNYNKDISKLSMFKTEGSVEERLQYLYKSAKHHIAKHLNYDIWLMADMVFNSILDINYGQKIRGALDVFFLGDTQVGKSETTSKLTQLYNFGQFLSLKTSTTIGLIGGSTKVDGSWCNTIGAIPKQNKKLVVLEEFSGASPSFIKTMTDIRSSNELRIARASGELRVPCKLRMITISNPINDAQGNPRFLCSFPNGVKPLMELITSAEDVARYDGFLLIPKVEKRFNPFDFKLEGTPIPKEAYEHKAQWVITRTADNVKYEDGVEAYIWDKAEELNSMFECNFPLFGTTTSLKLARFSVALASLIMNVDDDYENIIVTKEIVDYVCDYLIHIYTHNCFRLDAYKKEYDAYNNYNQIDIDVLQKLYPANIVTIDFLASTAKTSRNSLRTISGLDGDRFNPVFNALLKGKFIKVEMDNVYPTEKFRKCYARIDKSFNTLGSSLIDNTVIGYNLKEGGNVNA